MSKSQKETLVNQAIRTIQGFEKINNKLKRKPVKKLPKCPICKTGNMHILAFGSGLDPPPDLEIIQSNRVNLKLF